MGEFRRPAPERLHRLDLCSRVRHVVRAANHVRDSHVEVVDDRCKGIQDSPVLPDQHRVRHAGCIDRRVAEDQVFPLDPCAIQLEAPGTCAAFGTKPAPVCIRELERCPVVDRRPAHVPLLLALELKFGGGFPSFVEPPQVPEPVRGFVVEVKPGGLVLDPVPIEAEPLEILPDGVDMFLTGTFRVGIVDTQDEGAARLPRNQPVQKRGTQIAHMDEAGWRRRESGDGHRDLLIGSASFT